jgi:hypothetical protein
MFIVHLYQNGGCDYTIGCGQVVSRLPDCVKTLEEAVNFVTGGEADGGHHPAQFGYYGDRVDRAEVFEVKSSVVIDGDALRRCEADRERQRLALEAVEKELAELERLKKKYEGK